MAAFKTGIELQQEKLQELVASNVKNIGGRTAQEQANRGIGAALGTALVGGMLQGDAGIAAGDIIAAQEKPPETAEDWAKVQKELFAAGLEEDGLSLTPKIKGLQEVAKSFADTKKTNKPITTDDDRTFVVDMIKARGADEESTIGTILAPMLSEDATTGQQGQVAVFRSAVAEKASTIHQQLIDRGIDGIDKSMIVQSLLDNIETSENILSPDTGFLWFGQNAGVNTKSLTGFLNNIGKGVVSQFEGGFKEAPVRPAPAQRTTQAPGKIDAQTGLPGTPSTAQAGGIGESPRVDPGTPLSGQVLTKAQEAMKAKLAGNLSPSARNTLQKQFEKSVAASEKKQGIKDRIVDIERQLEAGGLSAQEKNNLMIEKARLKRK